jgi:hypothetical protein
MRTSIGITLLAILMVPCAWAQQTVEDLVQAAGIEGGLIVQIGCGNGHSLAALHNSDSFVVQGLDTDLTKVQTDR